MLERKKRMKKKRGKRFSQLVLHQSDQMHICNFSWYAVSSNSLLTPIQYTYSISLQLCQAWQQLQLPACASLVYLSCLSARERPPGRGAHRHTTPPASLPANRPFFILYGSYKNYETARIFRKAKERKL